MGERCTYSAVASAVGPVSAHRVTVSLSAKRLCTVSVCGHCGACWRGPCARLSSHRFEVAWCARFTNIDTTEVLAACYRTLHAPPMSSADPHPARARVARSDFTSQPTPAQHATCTSVLAPSAIYFHLRPRSRARHRWRRPECSSVEPRVSRARHWCRRPSAAAPSSPYRRRRAPWCHPPRTGGWAGGASSACAACCTTCRRSARPTRRRR